MTEIKKLVIKASLTTSIQTSQNDEKGKKTIKPEELEEKLSDLKVEIADLVDKKIEQYHRKQNKH
jgi:hypothetical protein